MMPFPGNSRSPVIAALVISLFLTPVAAYSQASTSVKRAGGDSVNVVGQLPRGMSVRGNQLILPRGYQLQRMSRKSGRISRPLGLAASGGGTKGGTGTIECDGCCDLASTGTPPKVYCQKTGNCGCSTVITIPTK